MNLLSLFKPKNYLNSLKAIRRSFVVAKLVKKPIPEVALSRIWPLQEKIKTSECPWPDTFNIFGTEFSLNEPICWHKDYVSGFEYPLKRFDKIKLSKWYNNGIDVKFPWELSRCHFLVNIGQNYYATDNQKHYGLFKSLVTDWIEKNTFLYGVNWVCTMDVSIRATNWIVSSCLFWKEIEKDQTFRKKLSVSLVQHAFYIDKFTENKGNNHDISNYAGLLFLSLFLKNHPESEKWLKKSICGLEENIRKQVFDDGVSVEYSTSYHRLVLEFFAYSFIIGKLHGIAFTHTYIEKLFKMFEFVAAYLNYNGLSPQVGDNDSGRFLVFYDSKCVDHKYSLNLGEHIFDYTFPSQCSHGEIQYNCWLPYVGKEDVPVKETRDLSKSVAFPDSGFYFLKTPDLNIMVNANNITKKSRVGHKHFDIGSYTLSYKGKQIVVDPGTYTYTRSLLKRNYFRDIRAHNTVTFNDSKAAKFSHSKAYFGGVLYFPKVAVLYFNEEAIRFNIYYGRRKIERFIKIYEKQVEITDKTNGIITSRTHIVSEPKKKANALLFSNLEIKPKGDSSNLQTRLWSPGYGVVTVGLVSLEVTGLDKVKLSMFFS